MSQINKEDIGKVHEAVIDEGDESEEEEDEEDGEGKLVVPEKYQVGQVRPGHELSSV